MFRSQTLRSAVLIVLGALSISAYAADESIKKVVVPAGPLTIALKALAEQSGVEFFYSTDQLEGLKTDGVQGEYTAEKAVLKLIEGTKLKLTRHESGALVITVPETAAALQGTSQTGKRMRLAQADTPSSSKGEDQGEDEKEAQSQKRIELEEITVTGTHIRGATSSASPLQVYSRDEIDRTGLGSVADFILRLPQNFKGGASEGTAGVISGGASANNVVNGTGVNLRGLGNNATLVLINGRRVAPGSLAGTWVDVSMIPLTAIERVEVLSDGASAIYGADAVGGVVNFVLRRDFEGAETRARYGTVTEGDSREIQVGQTLAQRWSGGRGLISYEYFDRTILDAGDKLFTSNLPTPFTLLPAQERHSAMLGIEQEISTTVDLFIDALGSKRSTLTYFSLGPTATIRAPLDIEAYSATFGGRMRLLGGAQLELSASYSETEAQQNSFRNDLNTIRNRTDVSISSFDAKMDGSLGAILSRPILYAAGAQYRQESYSQDDQLRGTTTAIPDRDVWATFAEIRAPLLERDPSRPMANDLELSLAGRYEKYNDFGSTFNPKLGLIWRPANAIGLRSSYGRSFKAPLLTDIKPTIDRIAAIPNFDPRTGGITGVLLINGGNPALKPEKAKTWTLGVDVTEALPGFSAAITYYDVRFTDRIVNFSSGGYTAFDLLRHEAVLGSSVIQRDPSQSVVEAFAANPAYDPAFATFYGIALSSVGAILDDRPLNLAEVNTEGLDVGLSYRNAESIFGDIRLGVDGTYILKFDNRFTETTPTVHSLNTPYNPVDLKLRGHVMTQIRDLTIGIFLNYTDSYSDNRSGLAIPVESWTTADLSVGYRLSAQSDKQGGRSLLLSVINVTGADPPFLRSPLAPPLQGLNFDGANATLLGRFVSLQLSWQW